MNKSETKAYNWLLSQGYDQSDIVFQHSRSPDFLLSDGKSFEIKRLYGATIWFTNDQFQKLQKHSNSTVLVYSDAIGNEPYKILPSEKLIANAIVDGLKIIVKEKLYSLYISDENWKWLMLLKLDLNLKSVDEVIGKLRKGEV